MWALGAERFGSWGSGSGVGGSRELGQDLGRVCCSEVGRRVGDGDGALRARGSAREHPGWEELTSE